MYANDFASFIDKSVDILIGNESEFFEIFQSTNINLISKKFLRWLIVAL